MVFFNYALRKLNAKIVYYGPGLCGKTTNLQWIHDHFEGGERGKMISLATEGDRTIFFDLLPIEIGTIRGMQVTLQLYTVPGQVHYNSTRQLVLKGADGVVFVADSQRAMQKSNEDSLRNLEENLQLQGIEVKGFPHVIQFNKRDLRDLMPPEELNAGLNRFSMPIFEAVATEGIGVQETLEGIVKLVMRSLRDRYEPAVGDRPGTGTGVASGPWTGGQPTAPRAPTAPRPLVPATPVPPPVVPVTPPADSPTDREAVTADLEASEGVNTAELSRPVDELAPSGDAQPVEPPSDGPDDVPTEVMRAPEPVPDDPWEAALAKPPYGGEPVEEETEAEPDDVDTYSGGPFPGLDTDADQPVPDGLSGVPSEDTDGGAPKVVTDVLGPSEVVEGELPEAETFDESLGQPVPSFDDVDADGGVTIDVASAAADLPGIEDEPPTEDDATDPGVFASAEVEAESPSGMSDSSPEPEPEPEPEPSGAVAGASVDDLVASFVRPAFAAAAAEEDDGEEEDLPDESADDDFVMAEDPTVVAKLPPRMTEGPYVVGDGEPFDELLGDDDRERPVPVTGELMPAADSSIQVQPDKDNQLRVHLEGTGALAEYGQVRELDVVVPVPGEWVGNRRVTLQLRLTLTPAAEETNGGNDD